MVYNRNARGEWFRNGKPVAEHRVPFKIRRLAYYMTPECTIKTRGEVRLLLLKDNPGECGAHP